MTQFQTITIELPKRSYFPVAKTVTFSRPQWEFRHLQTVSDDCLRSELITCGHSVLGTMRKQGDTGDSFELSESLAHFQLYAEQCEERGFQSHVEYVAEELAIAVARLQEQQSKAGTL